MTVPAWDEDLSTQVRGKQADIRSLAAQAQKVVKQNQAQITLLQNQLKAVQRESEAEERYAATLHASGVDVQRASVERELDEMARLFEAESLKCAGVTSAIKPLQAQVLSARRAAMNGGKPPMVSAARAKKRHDISQAKLQRVLGACSEAEREAERLRLELSSLLREKRACEEKMSGLQAERLLHEASAAKDSEATTLAATSCSAARSHMRALEAQLERHTRWRSAQQLEMERKVRLAEVKRSKSGSRQREALSAALALSHIAKKGEEKDIAASMTISRSRLSAGKSALLADAKVADCIAALQEFHGADGTQDVGTLIARLLAADEANAAAAAHLSGLQGEIASQEAECASLRQKIAAQEASHARPKGLAQVREQVAKAEERAAEATRAEAEAAAAAFAVADGLGAVCSQLAGHPPTATTATEPTAILAQRLGQLEQLGEQARRQLAAVKAEGAA